MSTSKHFRILDDTFRYTTPAGTALRGNLEHFPAVRRMVIFGDSGVDVILLTVNNDEHTKPLQLDEVLLSNWSELRGVPQELAARGHIELTGETVHIGQFRLEALVARVL